MQNSGWALKLRADSQQRRAKGRVCLSGGVGYGSGRASSSRAQRRSRECRKTRAFRAICVVEGYRLIVSTYKPLPRKLLVVLDLAY